MNLMDRIMDRQGEYAFRFTSASASQREFILQSISAIDDAKAAWLDYVAEIDAELGLFETMQEDLDADLDAYFKMCDELQAGSIGPVFKEMKRTITTVSDVSVSLCATMNTATRWSTSLLEHQLSSIIDQRYGHFDFAKVFRDVVMRISSEIAKGDLAAQTSISFLESIRSIAESFPVLKNDLKKGADAEDYFRQQTLALRLWTEAINLSTAESKRIMTMALTEPN